MKDLFDCTKTPVLFIFMCLYFTVLIGVKDGCFFYFDSHPMHRKQFVECKAAVCVMFSFIEDFALHFEALYPPDAIWEVHQIVLCAL
jgi:hypothetical protein